MDEEVRKAFKNVNEGIGCTFFITMLIFILISIWIIRQIATDRLEFWPEFKQIATQKEK